MCVLFMAVSGRRVRGSVSGRRVRGSDVPSEVAGLGGRKKLFMINVSWQVAAAARVRNSGGVTGSSSNHAPK